MSRSDPKRTIAVLTVRSPVLYVVHMRHGEGARDELSGGIVSFNTVINKIEDRWAWATWLWASICGNTRTLNATLKSFEATTWRWGLELFERAQKVSIQADLASRHGRWAILDR
eukprot:symbB.v1.2.032059.t1/scaffold3764.1/size50773/2